MFAELFASSAVIITVVALLIVGVKEAHARIADALWHWRAMFNHIQWQKRITRVRHNQQRLGFIVSKYVRHHTYEIDCYDPWHGEYIAEAFVDVRHARLRKPVIRHAVYNGYFPIVYQRNLRND